jgi:hypothetical protein
MIPIRAVMIPIRAPDFRLRRSPYFPPGHKCEEEYFPKNDSHISVIGRREATKQSGIRTPGLLHRCALRKDGKGKALPVKAQTFLLPGFYFPEKHLHLQ